MKIISFSNRPVLSALMCEGLRQTKMRVALASFLLGSSSLLALSSQGIFSTQAMAQDIGYHGTSPLTSESSSTQREMKKGQSGKAMNGFGRLFSLKGLGNSNKDAVAPQSSPIYDLRQLGNKMKEPKSWEKDPNRSSIMPSGYVFFGQFIDHDITLDTISQLDKPLREGMLQNQRTVALDLDNVYGGGPDRSAPLYNLPWLRVGKRIDNVRSALPRHDLLRSGTGSGAGAYGGGGTALIGDFRNDENFILSQLQMAFISFHNRIVNQLIEKDYGSRRAEFCGSVSACKTVESLVASDKFPGSAKMKIFEKARDHVIHYYHRIISEDFLPRLIGAKRASDILRNGRNFYFPKGFVHKNGKLEVPFIPIEFAGAAYRYGHAQVKQTYRNRAGKDGELPLFRAGGHGHGSRVAGFNAIKSDRIIDWKYYFPLTKDTPDGFNFANKLTPFLPAHLHNLGRVGVTGNDVVSLAARNLNRGRIYRLPSGQDLAKKILPKLQQRGILKSWVVANPDSKQSVKLSWQDFIQNPDSMTTNILGHVNTPLWYYVLQEAAAFNVAGQTRIKNPDALGQLGHRQQNRPSQGWGDLSGFGLPNSFYSSSSQALPLSACCR